MKINDINLNDYEQDKRDDIIEYIMSIVDEEISKPNYTYEDKNGNIGKLNNVSFNELNFRSFLEEFSYYFVISYLAVLTRNDLVIVNSFADCSVACSTDQGQIRSSQGKIPGVKTIDESIMTGLFHYGTYGPCRHRVRLFIDGFTEMPIIYNEEVMEKARKVTASKRYVERNIRKYKALNNKAKVKEWSKRPHDKNRVW